MVELLRLIGEVVKVDYNTLLHQKDRFARVCLDISIIEPLLDTLMIHTPLHELLTPIIYEEACCICGNDTHSFDQHLCPSIPKIEVAMKKFQPHCFIKHQASYV